MYDYYRTLIGRGMKKIMALVAVARKLLRIIFAMVRDNRAGREKLDRDISGKAALE